MKKIFYHLLFLGCTVLFCCLPYSIIAQQKNYKTDEEEDLSEVVVGYGFTGYIIEETEISGDYIMQVRLKDVDDTITIISFASDRQMVSGKSKDTALHRLVEPRSKGRLYDFVVYAAILPDSGYLSKYVHKKYRLNFLTDRSEKKNPKGAIGMLVGQNLFGQSGAVTFTNHGEPFAFGKDTFYSSRIHEITLKSDSTFEFWSHPFVSCLSWHRYEGTWKNEKDTLIFSDHYEVLENDVRATYKKNSIPFFLISFKTDKNSTLRSRKMKVKYIYDYNAHLDELEKIFDLKSDNTLEIPFKDIPNRNQLAAIRVEYKLDFKENRDGYLTQNKPLNIKRGDIPNIISVEFVEAPKREVVHRTIKGVIQKNTLVIVSTTKTKTTLPDYNGDIEFEDRYPLRQ